MLEFARKENMWCDLAGSYTPKTSHQRKFWVEHLA